MNSSSYARGLPADGGGWRDSAGQGVVGGNRIAYILNVARGADHPLAIKQGAHLLDTEAVLFDRQRGLDGADAVLAPQARRWLRILTGAPAAKGFGDGSDAVEQRRGERQQRGVGVAGIGPRGERSVIQALLMRRGRVPWPMPTTTKPLTSRKALNKKTIAPQWIWRRKRLDDGWVMKRNSGPERQVAGKLARATDAGIGLDQASLDRCRDHLGRQRRFVLSKVKALS